MYLRGRGGTRMARGGIRLVHGHTKSTLITYFSGIKIDPKYAFLHAFFLICPSCPFKNLSIWPKTHPFFQFCTFLHPKRCTRLKNNPNYVNFWTSLIPPWHSSGPPGMYLNAFRLWKHVTVKVDILQTTVLVSIAAHAPVSAHPSKFEIVSHKVINHIPISIS